MPAEAATRSSAMSPSGLVMTLLVKSAPGPFVQPVVMLAANSSSLAPVVVSGPLSFAGTAPPRRRGRVERRDRIEPGVLEDANVDVYGGHVEPDRDRVRPGRRCRDVPRVVDRLREEARVRRRTDRARVAVPLRVGHRAHGGSGVVPPDRDDVEVSSRLRRGEVHRDRLRVILRSRVRHLHEPDPGRDLRVLRTATTQRTARIPPAGGQ